MGTAVGETVLETAALKHHTFVFLEIFSQEGGIQSYIKDVLNAYLEGDEAHTADIFLLRDRPSSATAPNPFEGHPRLEFHYCKSPTAQIGRLRLAAELFSSLVRDRPRRLICGHVFLTPLIRPLCQLLNLPYTVVTYGKEVWQPVSPGMQRGLREAEDIWTISRYSRDRLCAANGIPTERVKMLPCVVDGDRFTPGPKSETLVTRYGLADAKVLMTVARLWSGDIYKGVDVTIRALPKILPVEPAVKYLVIGRGDDQPRLAQLAQDLGVADHVVFAGFVATKDLVDHYRLADAYIMPSQEGFGIVYLEAMACGVPVLSGDDDGSADPVQDGRVGWQVPHRDPEAVASACLELLQGTDPRCQGDWLRQEALAKFSQTALAQQVAQLLA